MLAQTLTREQGGYFYIGVNMEYHEIANIFPMMNADEYLKLKADIADNGFDNSLPIITLDNKILDGRNRYRACKELYIEPTYKEFEGEDPFTYVVRTNLHRRHLSSGQLAFVALDIEKHYGKEARKKELERKEKQYIPKQQTTFPILGKSELKPVHAIEKASKEVGVSEGYISDAKKIQKEAPELAQRIIAGEMSIPEAKKEIKKVERLKMHEDKRMRSLPNGKYSVIYADPPWQYDNSGFNESADNQYPTMPIDEICDLPIEQLADNATVLFLWATNPLLIEALRVMREWGFEYKTNMAWIKDAGRGKGWFLKSKHELLLIGTRPGSPHPAYRPDSCFEADRGNVHSRKPNLAREIIEQMYSGKKIELFAREKYNDWEVWGNEPDINS